MKKVFAVIASIVFSVFALAACAGSVSEPESQSVPLSDMELEFPYYDHSVSLEKVYAREVESDYEYRLYTISVFDLSSLSDKERHFFGDDVDITNYLDKGDNDIDFESMTLYPEKGEAITPDGKYYRIDIYPSPYSSSSTDNRESYLGTELVIAAMVTDPQNNKDKDYDWNDFQTSGVIDAFTTESEFNDALNVLGWESL